MSGGGNKDEELSKLQEKLDQANKQLVGEYHQDSKSAGHSSTGECRNADGGRNGSILTNPHGATLSAVLSLFVKIMVYNGGNS